ncbi:MAG: CPBP family intramembrane metalloprotease, partial [Actinomyces sp.]|nr:CPBP family intramembrane metalloprotease [Actinomyces sp.]
PLPAYHRLARTGPRYRWWKPLVTLLVSGAVWFALVIGAGLALNVVSGRDVVSEMAVETPPLDDPLGLALQLFFVFAMLPAVLVAVRVVEGRRPATLVSVLGRMRWGLLARGGALATVLIGLTMAASSLIGDSPVPSTSPATGGRLLAMLAVVVVAVPLQAAAEEFVFRGLLIQTVGAWVRPAWVAILLQVPFFALGHVYGWKGMVDVSVFAVVTGWLTLRTGGLEAAIGLHAANNVLAFAAGVLGWSDPSSDQVPVGALVLSQVVTLTYAVLVERVGRRRGWWSLPLSRPLPLPRDPEGRPATPGVATDD